MDLEEYQELVSKYWCGSKRPQAIKKIAEVCMYAGYMEQDISELCYSIGNEFENI